MAPKALFLTRDEFNDAHPFSTEQLDAFLNSERRWEPDGVTLSFPSYDAFTAFANPLPWPTEQLLQRVAHTRTTALLDRVAALDPSGPAAMLAPIVTEAKALAALLRKVRR